MWPPSVKSYHLPVLVFARVAYSLPPRNILSSIHTVTKKNDSNKGKVIDVYDVAMHAQRNPLSMHGHIIYIYNLLALQCYDFAAVLCRALGRFHNCNIASCLFC